MSAKLLLGWSFLLLIGGARSALSPLVVEGRELHASLATRKLADAAKLHLAPVLRGNPYLSSDAEFVDVLARIASQGRLRGEGVRAALYALYFGEAEVGLYGLEAASLADADRLEGPLRAIWKHNGNLGLARVHRKGRVLVVVWHNGVSLSCWEAVNAGVVKRMSAPSPVAGRESPIAVSDTPGDAKAQELKALAGTWKPLFAVNNGYGSDQEADLEGTRWIREPNGKWTFWRDGKAVVEWTVKAIDVTQRPRTIDIEITAGPYKGVVYKGIYELVGDRLRICFALPDRPERPTEFSAGKGSLRALSEFHREER